MKKAKSTTAATVAGPEAELYYAALNQKRKARKKFWGGVLSVVSAIVLVVLALAASIALGAAFVRIGEAFENASKVPELKKQVDTLIAEKQDIKDTVQDLRDNLDQMARSNYRPFDKKQWIEYSRVDTNQPPWIVCTNLVRDTNSFITVDGYINYIK